MWFRSAPCSGPVLPAPLAYCRGCLSPLARWSPFLSSVWVAGAEPSLRPGSTSRFIMACDPCYAWSSLVRVWVHQGYWPVISFFAVCLSGFGTTVMPASQDGFRSDPSSSGFRHSLRRRGLPLTRLVGLPREVTGCGLCLLGVFFLLLIQF